MINADYSKQGQVQWSLKDSRLMIGMGQKGWRAYHDDPSILSDHAGGLWCAAGTGRGDTA